MKMIFSIQKITYKALRIVLTLQLWNRWALRTYSKTAKITTMVTNKIIVHLDLEKTINFRVKLLILKLVHHCPFALRL